MQKVTPNQIQKIHVLLNKLGLIEEKRNLVSQITDGRTQSTKELSCAEAAHFITILAQYDPTEKQRGLIFSLAYKAGIIYGDSQEDKKMNAAKLNLFLKERGAVKKALNEMTYSELVTTHRQFKAIAKGVKKAADNREAGAAVRQLLTEVEGILTA